VCFSTGLEAFAWIAKEFSEGHGFPAAILVDRRMNGGISGDEVAQRVRAIDPSAEFIPLFALTSYLTDLNMKRAKDAGFDGCFKKTSSAEEFAAQLRMIVR